MGFVEAIQSTQQKQNLNNYHCGSCECELLEALLSTVFYIIKYRAFTIVPGIIVCFMVLFFCFTYYLMMTLLTIDRLLICFVNLKYQLYVTTRNLLKLKIAFVSILSFTFSTPGLRGNTDN